MFDIVLPPDVLAMAMYTAQERPKRVSKHNPPSDPDADLVGAICEHGWAFAYRLPQSSITYDGGPDGWGDGGIDFHMAEGTVDLKASHKWPESWVVKRGDLRADWYVFATVYIEVGRVVYKAKALREYIERVPRDNRVGGNRLVRLGDPGMEDIALGDFSLE